MDGRIMPGQQAQSVLVFETPAAEFPLARGVAAHAALIRELARTLSAGGTSDRP